MSRTSKSEGLFERAKKVTPGGVHSPVRAFRGVGGTPRFIQEAKGVILKDVDGVSYIDFCLSWGPLILGHQDEEVREAALQAMDRGWSYGAAEPYSLELAELITTQLPWAEKIRFVNSGTEAVMSALRVARGATGRSLVMKFDGCYHGHVDSMLVRAGSGLAEMSSPDSAGVSHQTAAETLVAPLNQLKQVQELFEQNAGRVAAVILEPLPANNGLLLQTPEFLTGVVALAKRSGALVIFDEVISGFRIGFGGMAEHTGIRPDLVTYGKVIGGGFPVGAYGGRADLMDLVAPVGPVYQAGTLSANPVAMSAGLATLKKLLKLNPYAELAKKTTELGQKLEALARQYGRYPLQVQSKGSVFWPVMGEVRSTDGVVRSIEQIPEVQKALFAKMFHGLLDRGVYLAPSGYEVGFVSTAHTESHLDRLVEAWEEVLKNDR